MANHNHKKGRIYAGKKTKTILGCLMLAKKTLKKTIETNCLPYNKRAFLHHVKGAVQLNLFNMFHLLLFSDATMGRPRKGQDTCMHRRHPKPPSCQITPGGRRKRRRSTMREGEDEGKKSKGAELGVPAQCKGVLQISLKI